METARINRWKFEPGMEVVDSLYTQIQKNANDSKIVMFTETSSPGNGSHCSQNPVMVLDSQIQVPKLRL